MRIGIACHPTFGGSGAVAADLAVALAERGHAVHVFSYERPFRLHGRPAEAVHFHEVEVSSYPLFKYPPYDLALAGRMIDVASREGLDVIHAHYAIPHAVSAYLAREALAEGRRRGARPPRVVTTLHGTDITLVGSETDYAALTRFALLTSDAVTAVSRYLADETRRVYDLPALDIQVLGNFLGDPPCCCSEGRRAEARERLGAGDRAVLVHASNFRPVKRVADAVRVLARVRRGRAGGALLLMMGEGPGRAEAEEEARALDVEDDVRFLGRVGEVSEVLAAADLFLLPSQYESFGLAALEAMNCGVPVIGTAAGGLPEVVEEGVSGHLLPVGDVDGMAARALALISDPARLEAFRARAREAVARRYDRDRAVSRYEALYLELLGRGLAPREA